MPPRLSSTTIQGFRAPVVNDGAIIVPVVIHVGEPLHGIAATPALWRELAAALAPLLDQAHAAAVASLPPSRAIRSASGRRMHACWLDLAAQPTQTTADCARRHGLSPGSFAAWCSHHYPGRLRAIRQSLGLSLAPRSVGKERQPDSPGHSSSERRLVLKPGGKLL